MIVSRPTRPNVAPCKGEPSAPFILAERLADRVDVVIGVDTHTDPHRSDSDPVGTVLAELTVPATAQGAAMLTAWADQTSKLGLGRRVWAIDGARSHGVGLLRVLRTAGGDALEAPTPVATARRRSSKSDALTRSMPPGRSWPPSTSPHPAPPAPGKPCAHCTSAAANLAEIRALVTTVCPALLDQPGIGPVTR